VLSVKTNELNCAKLSFLHYEIGMNQNE